MPGRCVIPVGAPHRLTGRQAPIILGHEVAGRIADVGPGVTGLRPGDLVALDANLSCGSCWWCARHQLSLCADYGAIGLSADGGLAEAVTVPAQMCLPVAESVGADSAALAEPLSVAVRGFRRGRLALDETVAVFGGGMIGVAALVVARAMGAGLIVVIDPVASPPPARRGAWSGRCPRSRRPWVRGGTPRPDRWARPGCHDGRGRHATGRRRGHRIGSTRRPRRHDRPVGGTGRARHLQDRRRRTRGHRGPVAHLGRGFRRGDPATRARRPSSRPGGRGPDRIGGDRVHRVREHRPDGSGRRQGPRVARAQGGGAS